MTESQTTEARGKSLVGVVVSDKMDKTIVVEVARRVRHPQYKKTITRFKKYYVHDEKDEAGVGDQVAIVETRPLSKLKRWRLTAVVRRSTTPEQVTA